MGTNRRWVALVAVVIAALLVAVGVPVSLFTLGRRSQPQPVEQPVLEPV